MQEFSVAASMPDVFLGVNNHPHTSGALQGKKRHASTLGARKGHKPCICVAVHGVVLREVPVATINFSPRGPV